mmetsp:Transcript_36062/g.35038  ORF Transcript_36062/g.35038 Transcript_36062/m.35038 type:complete len:105 (-) Transcript_36062:370-684(-)
MPLVLSFRDEALELLLLVLEVTIFIFNLLTDPFQLLHDVFLIIMRFLMLQSAFFFLFLSDLLKKLVTLEHVVLSITPSSLSFCHREGTIIMHLLYLINTLVLVE